MGARLSYPEVNLKDKVAIVTGGNTGIGYETVKALAFMGAHTILASRTEERGQKVNSLFASSALYCIFTHKMLQSAPMCYIPSHGPATPKQRHMHNVIII